MKLAEKYKISRMTIRKAINRLVDRGFLIRKGTSGTFIPSPVIMRPIDAHMYPYSISDMVKKSGDVPGSKLLFFEKPHAQARIAEQLELNVGDPLIVIRRLRLMDDIPFCVETAHLPAKFVPGLVASDLIAEPCFMLCFKVGMALKWTPGRGQLAYPPLPQKKRSCLNCVKTRCRLYFMRSQKISSVDRLSI